MSTGAGVACDVRPTWWASRWSILRGARRESIRIENRKLIHRRFPVGRRATPIGGDITQRQPDQFGGRLVAREVAAGLDDLAQPRIGGNSRRPTFACRWETDI